MNGVPYLQFKPSPASGIHWYALPRAKTIMVKRRTAYPPTDLPQPLKMTRQPRFVSRTLTRNSGFVPITLDEYTKMHLASNPGVDAAELKTRLRKALAAKEAGERCDCGGEIWVLGSAEVGLMCFTCITGEAMPDKNYELYSE